MGPSEKKSVGSRRERDKLTEKIRESIMESVLQNNQQDNPVSIGNKFCEWVLNNVFDLREDELIEAEEIGGQSDNGIDAVFQINDELFIIQCKFGNSHSVESMLKFNEDCKRVLVETPISNRQVVLEKCKDIRQQNENDEAIHCYYVTNNVFSKADNIRKNEIKRIKTNVSISFLDLDGITEKIAEKNGSLPKGIRDKVINLRIDKYFEIDNTIIAIVSLEHFYLDLIKPGGNLLFHSNIRNYLNSTDINIGIKKTLETNPGKFWYYNNGVTIVCDTYGRTSRVLSLTSPQIVNGCQTAKSIEKFFNTKTGNEKIIENIDGNLLIKVIKPKTSDNDDMKKDLRDNITRFTNKQNAVKGLDFYALDEFQRSLQNRFERLGYYYEIQRGAFITLDKAEQSQFKGIEQYSYLVPSNFKNILPAKEVIQNFTAGIKQNPNIAYGKPKELTPIGDKWDEVCNQDTKNLEVEFFLFPYLIYIYAKNFLGYSTRSQKGTSNINDFRRASSLLYVATYYLLLMEIFSQIHNHSYEKPEEIIIKEYRRIFENSDANMRLLKLSDKILDDYFGDSKIEDEGVSDDIKNFLKVKVTKKDYWAILEKKIKRAVEADILEMVEALIK